ncbi:TetR/AcrR family transcriptional regulator [Catellatospora paridis]|uniref:TetR/AcrR family transcriptional regulator n=1 Tax=Catellatospora paridis TaxID=1617086 RepID=UPI0012D39BC1|nr:TetR/AcrR family transcriptional regulator [Catellatospora paridis]
MRPSLAAASDAFSLEGLDASLEAIARQAGLAIGTLYRHFPTRFDLVQQAYGGKLQAWLDAAEASAAEPDAWQLFGGYLETLCELQADDSGMNDLASMHLPLPDFVAGKLRRIRDLTQAIVDNAHEQGTLRTDVTRQDLAFAIWAHSRIAAATRDVAPEAWRRHLHLMLDAFRAGHTTALPVPAMTQAQVDQAMINLGSANSAGD